MGRVCSTKEVEEERIQVIGSKARGSRPLERSGFKWMDNIKIGLRDIGWGGVDWIGLAKDRNRWRALVNVVINQFP
jgi:hypothetical protein